MHQYKTVTQILLILSIFNLVLGAPVVREIYDARDDVAVGNVAVISKGQHLSRSNEATASPSSPPTDGSTTSPSSPPPLDESTTSHSSPVLPEELPPLYTSSPSEGEPDSWTDFHNLAMPPSGLPSLPVSSPPGEIVLATDQPVPVLPGWSSQQEADAASLIRLREMMEANRVLRQTTRTVAMKFAGGLAILGITGGMIAYYRHRNHHHRTIDLDWYVSNPPSPSCRHLNILSENVLTDEFFLSSESTVKGSRQPWPDK